MIELCVLNERYKGYYATTCGKIISCRQGKPKILKARMSKDGYGRVVLAGDEWTIHRIVCQCYIPNPEKKETVDHINFEKLDNYWQNLRWATRKEQVESERYKSIRGYRVIGRDKQGETVEEFVSIKEAVRNGFNAKFISRIISGKPITKAVDGKMRSYIPKTHKGLYWGRV